MSALNKKELKQQVEEKLALAFGDLKDRIGSKKFNKNVKKAGKRLLSGLKHTPGKNAAPKEKAETPVTA